MICCTTVALLSKCCFHGSSSSSLASRQTLVPEGHAQGMGEAYSPHALKHMNSNVHLETLLILPDHVKMLIATCPIFLKDFSTAVPKRTASVGDCQAEDAKASKAPVLHISFTAH